MTAVAAHRGLPPGIRPAEIAVPATVLGISASAKPAQGVDAASAVRGYLVHMLGRLAATCPAIQLLDLRETPLPLFDGRMPGDVDDGNVRLAAGCVGQAGALLLSVPAYWNCVGAVFKNFCEVLAGPAYDLEGAATLFHGKPIGLLIVGADESSAAHGAAQAVAIMEALGGHLVRPPVAVANPRTLGSEDQLADIHSQLLQLGATTALAGLQQARSG